MPRAAVLIVDDDAVFRAALRRYVESIGHEVAAVGDAEAGFERLESQHFDLVLTDLRMPGSDGIQFLGRIRSHYPDVATIIVTAFGSTEKSVEALRAGAFWFIEKNYERMDTFGLLIERALEPRALRSSNQQLQRQLKARYGMESIIGESETLEAALETLRFNSRTLVRPS